MDVKLLTSQRFLERLRRAVSGEPNLGINFQRYWAFKHVFGESEYGFVLSGDLQREIETGKEAPVYSFADNFAPYRTEETGIECELLIASAFGNHGFPSRKEVERIMDYVGEKMQAGNIGDVVNSRRATLSEDKLSALELPYHGIQIPDTHHFQDSLGLEDFLEHNPGRYVLKHRFGEGGKETLRVENSNFDLGERDINDFVLQPELDIVSEKRLILFDGRLMGARIIQDRHRPWEEEGKVGRRHETKRYKPYWKEFEDTKTILQHFDALAGCVDWVELRKEGRCYMEYNGIGTGWGTFSGPRSDPYDLNLSIAWELKEKYF